MICLAALAMRRRSRSVPRDAHEREQIVGLLMRTRPTDPPKDPTVAKHAHLTRASGRKSRSDKRRCERQGTPNSKPANIPDSIMPQKALLSINQRDTTVVVVLPHNPSAPTSRWHGSNMYEWQSQAQVPQGRRLLPRTPHLFNLHPIKHQ